MRRTHRRSVVTGYRAGGGPTETTHGEAHHGSTSLELSGEEASALARAGAAHSAYASVIALGGREFLGYAAVIRNAVAGGSVLESSMLLEQCRAPLSERLGSHQRCECDPTPALIIPPDGMSERAWEASVTLSHRRELAALPSPKRPISIREQEPRS